jgi:hypothetical protein
VGLKPKKPYPFDNVDFSAKKRLESSRKVAVFRPILPGRPLDGIEVRVLGLGTAALHPAKVRERF